MDNNKSIFPVEPKKPVNGKLIDAVMRALGKEYVLLGKTRVKTWQAWLVLGLAVGAATGVLLVANRSGQFQFGKAAGSPTLTVLAPNGGEIWAPGKAYDIKWCRSGSLSRGSGRISLVKQDGTFSALIKEFREVRDCSTAGSTFSWTAPATLPPGSDYAVEALYRKAWSDVKFSDASDAPFAVALSLPDPATVEAMTRILAANAIATTRANVNIRPFPVNPDAAALLEYSNTAMAVAVASEALGDSSGASIASHAAVYAAAVAVMADPTLSPTTSITIVGSYSSITIDSSTVALSFSVVPTAAGVIDVVSFTATDFAALAHAMAIEAQALATTNNDVVAVVAMAQTVSQLAEVSKTAAEQGNLLAAFIAVNQTQGAYNALQNALSGPAVAFGGLNATLSLAVTNGTLTMAQAQAVQAGLDSGTISPTAAGIAAALGAAAIYGGPHGPMGSGYSPAIAIALGATNFGGQSIGGAALPSFPAYSGLGVDDGSAPGGGVSGGGVGGGPGPGGAGVPGGEGTASGPAAP